jgi:hypothetical protein
MSRSVEIFESPFWGFPVFWRGRRDVMGPELGYFFLDLTVEIADYYCFGNT